MTLNFCQTSFRNNNVHQNSLNTSFLHMPNILQTRSKVTYTIKADLYPVAPFTRAVVDWKDLLSLRCIKGRKVEKSEALPSQKPLLTLIVFLYSIREIIGIYMNNVGRILPLWNYGISASNSHSLQGLRSCKTASTILNHGLLVTMVNQ